MRKISERIILLGLLIYSAFATTSTSLQTGGICLGIIGLIPLIFLEYKSLKKIPFNIPILLFIISLIISSIFSKAPMESLNKTESIIRKILVYYLVVFGISDIKWAKRLIYILLISGGIGVIIKWQLGFYERLDSNRSLGGTLGMMLPISICFCLYLKPVYQRIGLGIISFIFLTFLLLTSTRGAWIGVIIAIISLGILKDKRVWLLIPLFLLYGSIFPKVTNRAILTFNPNYSPNLCRIYIWKGALKTIKKNPILGIGASFEASERGEISLYTGKFHSHCHNNFLNVAVSSGLFGLFAFTSLLTVIFMYFINTFHKNDYLRLSLFASLIDWFFHGLVDTTYLGRLGYLFWFILGIMVILDRKCTNTHNEYHFH